MATAEGLARRFFDTTAVDVANALAAGTVEPDEVPTSLLDALEKEGVEPDDDPDEMLGWAMGPDGQPVPEPG